MQNPYISVLLCTYNDSKYIRHTIKSILRQTYTNFEFIIVNDGSTDNTTDIIREFNDPRIILINKENTGLTDSLNLGIKYAKGEWIARIDGDDIAKKNRFEEQVKYLNKDVAVIGTQCEFIDYKGKYISKSKLALTHKQILSQGLRFKTMFIHPATIINRKKLISVGGYDPLIDAAEDLDLWLKMSVLGELVNLDNALIEYRLHPNKISNYKRSTQLLNAAIAINKYEQQIYRNLNRDEYLNIKTKIEKSRLFLFIQNLSMQTIGMKGFLLKLYNAIIKFSWIVYKNFR